MGRRARYCLILLVVGMGSVRVSAAACGAIEAVRQHWDRTRDLLMLIIEAIPEDKYDFKPVPEVRSFREMLHHMVTDTQTHIGYVAGRSREESEKFSEKYKDAKTRAELLQGLKESFDYGTKVFADLKEQNADDMVTEMRGERVTRFLAALDAFADPMDHYGNIVVYLRLNGIVPPRTASRQQPPPQ